MLADERSPLHGACASSRPIIDGRHGRRRKRFGVRLELGCLHHKRLLALRTSHLLANQLEFRLKGFVAARTRGFKCISHLRRSFGVRDIPRHRRASRSPHSLSSTRFQSSPTLPRSTRGRQRPGNSLRRRAITAFGVRCRRTFYPSVCDFHKRIFSPTHHCTMTRLRQVGRPSFQNQLPGSRRI